jgi:membrane protease YdiL (CAAX protease family)
MTKRFFLTGITLLSLVLLGLSLFASWQKPQFQSILELYQTNIVLQAQTWEAYNSNDNQLSEILQAIVGDGAIQNANNQYEETRNSVQKSIDKAETVTNSVQEISKTRLEELFRLRDELDLQLGILQAKQGNIKTAISTWNQIQPSERTELTKTAQVLIGIWNTPPRLLPNAQPLIQKNLAGWFRYTALTQLYEVQQRLDALTDLQAAQEVVAKEAVFKLAIITVVPGSISLIGIVLLISLIIQRLIKGRESILAQNAQRVWLTPWNLEIVLQVFIVGFFLMGQVFVPTILQLLPISPYSENLQIQAFSVLISYILVSFGALSVLYISIKRYLPLPEEWFKFRLFDNWLLWGIGGYCAAVPIVIIVSLINQILWKGEGGSNPLLQMALENRDGVALGIFFLTAAIAAPLFEEFLFRGFLLPSLTSHLPVSWAIVVSSFIFAIAHLSLSEMLPLTALGIVLGVVYTRSRNLLAPMLLHGLWNSGTLVSLFILGGSNS